MKYCKNYQNITWSGYISVGPSGLLWWLKQLRIHLQCGRPGFNPWVGKIPWRRAWQPTPVLLPGESHGQRILVGHSPWGHKESDTTERLSTPHEVSKCCWKNCFNRLAWCKVATNLQSVKNLVQYLQSTIKWGIPAQLSLSIQGGLVLGPPRVPKPADAQVPYIKWCSTVSPLYWWVPHPQIQRADHIRKK